VLSEGHAVPVVYAACVDLGIHMGKDKQNLRAMTRQDALSLREIGSVVDGHPNPAEGFPFFDTATGSLGQGLSHAAGLAAAAKIDGLDKRIYCIIGDGEAREGQVWEALDFIQDHGLKAVCPIFNCNVYGQSDQVSRQQSPEVLTAKLEAAGYDVLVIDGHVPSQVQIAFARHTEAQGQADSLPVAIVAKTVKGWGAASQQGPGHHGQPVTGDELAKVLEEIAVAGRSLGATADTSLKIGMMSPKKPEPATTKPVVGFESAMKQFGLDAALDKGTFATRRAYGVALRALGHTHSNVVAMDADASNSTFSDMFHKDEALSDRYFECRIAEQNMFSVAAGLSAAGKTPFCSTFAKFAVRGYDQIEMAVNSGANFKVIGSHAGISLAADGPSQMSLPDVAWFRAFSTMKRQNGTPGFYVLQPSDAYQAYALTVAMAEYDGP